MKNKNNRNKEYLKYVNHFYGNNKEEPIEETDYVKTTRFERK